MTLLSKDFFFRIATLFVVLAGVSPAVADEYEWDPSSGYHEEEWYDPGDWFNDDGNVEYEPDYFGSYYDGDDQDTSDSWYGDNYYTDEWYDEEPGFDDWYDNDDAYDSDTSYSVEEYEEEASVQ